MVTTPNDDRPSDADVQEAFAGALVAEDELAGALKDLGVPDPAKYPDILSFTRAYAAREVPRCAVDPWLPVTIWSAWDRIRRAGEVYDRRYRR